jgi:tetratricopeptide (TPR) repeat protein
LVVVVVAAAAAASQEEIEACQVLGAAYVRMGDVASASEALKRALALSHESGDRRGEARCLEGFGRLFRGLWILRRAADHFERALSIYIEVRPLATRRGHEIRGGGWWGVVSFDSPL